jgi:hypothetical protein
LVSGVGVQAVLTRGSQIAQSPSRACQEFALLPRPERCAATATPGPLAEAIGRLDPAAAAVMLSVVMASYPRRQQLRRLMSAARYAGCAAIATAASALLASAGQIGLAVIVGALAAGLGLWSRRAARLARRSRVGAESEAQVRRALKPLTREGWHVSHAVDWPGRGDLDHVLRSPSGMGFVIETKTLRYSRAHVLRTIDEARWLARKRRRYPCGVLPVVCVSRARGVERFEEDVLVVSLDRLMRALRQTHAVPR